MFDLIRDYSGVVVLHDFYLSGIMAHRDFQGLAPGTWPKTLYQSHGYPALKAYDSKEGAELIWQYPASLSVIQEALGLIVHSAHSIDLGQHWYGGDFSPWTVIPLLRTHPIAIDRGNSRQRLGLKDGDIVVCAFGHLGPSKLNDRLTILSSGEFTQKIVAVAASLTVSRFGPPELQLLFALIYEIIGTGCLVNLANLCVASLAGLIQYGSSNTPLQSFDTRMPGSRNPNTLMVNRFEVGGAAEQIKSN
jgi:hypothetical protein